jgi:hypothetical protein
MTYDLAVAYRICAKCSAHWPPVFPDNKYELAALCLKSFKESLGTLRVKIFVIMDGPGCFPEFDTLFTDLWAPEDLVFIACNGIGDQGTLKEQIRILLAQNDSEVVYLAEDDYFYCPGEFQSAYDFLRNNSDVDFVSCYDHPDIYKTVLHDIEHDRRSDGAKTWRTCMSTTHTFLTTKSALRKVKRVFTGSYFGFSPDLSKWMAITKHRIGPWFFLYALGVNKFWAFSIFMAWLFCWRQIIFGRRYTLWIPISSIATHMVAGMEAPHVDWKELWSNYYDGRTKALSGIHHYWNS